MRFPTSFMGGGSDVMYFLSPLRLWAFAVMEIGTRNATIQMRMPHFTQPATWMAMVYVLLAPQVFFVLIQLITR